MSNKLPAQQPPVGFQLPTSHSVQLKPVRPPPQPTQLQQQQQQNNNAPTISPRSVVGNESQSPSPSNVVPSSPNTIRQSPSSSPNVARKVPPPPQPTGGPPSSYSNNNNNNNTTAPQPQPPQIVMPPPPSAFGIKKLSPSSSPILPKRNISSPPLNAVNNNNTNNPLPPPIVHLPPPPPQSMLNLSGGNMPPPPPQSMLNLSGGNMPPPPPQSMLNHSGGNMPPPPRNTYRNSDGYSNTNNNSSNSVLNNNNNNNNGNNIPPPQFNNNNSNNSNNGNNSFVNSASSSVSPSLQSANSMSYLKPNPPMVPTRSASLDPKQMGQFIKTPLSPSQVPQQHQPSGPSPPPFISISPLKRNSIDSTNKRLSQDLNSMLVNRLQHGLSPPVATPFFDDKVLGSASKSAELKEKRDKEELERKERERLRKEKEEADKKDKKDKKGKEEQDKKDKKKKEEQEKLEKKEKKRKEEEEKKLKSSIKKSSDSAAINTNIFNNSLSQIMDNQRDSQPSLPYPVILKLLTEGVLNLNGAYTEGIFRITGSGTEVNRLKKQINEHDFSLDTSDPHVLAGLLKLWFRELTQPIIPSELYNDCIKCRSKDDINRVINQIPDQNKEVLNYLLSFLKNISQPQYSSYTKMNCDNFAVVFAPGLLRYTGGESTDMLLNSQYEKDFVKQLIEMSP